MQKDLEKNFNEPYEIISSWNWNKRDFFEWNDFFFEIVYLTGF